MLVGLDNPFTDAAVHETRRRAHSRPLPSWEDGNNPWLPFGVHHHNLTQAGVHRIQNLNLTEIAQKKIYLGAVFILPIRFTGWRGQPGPSRRDRAPEGLMRCCHQWCVWPT